MAPSKQLANILEGFNRKERNLLVRDILGHAEAKLKLSGDFRLRLHEATGVTLSADAWWATDYHFDWLFAALTVFYGATELGVAHQDHTPKFIRASQEDVDLIIVDGQHVIIIEAKAYEAWSNKPAASKRRRFEALLEYVEQSNQSCSGGPPVSIQFLLMSPRAPQGLLTKPGLQKLVWLKLKIDKSLSSYRVKRCDKNGKIDKNGNHWIIIEKTVSNLPQSSPD